MNAMYHLIHITTLIKPPNSQLTETYRNSLVGDAFDRIDIEAFSKGSVLVDYYVYFKHFDEQVCHVRG